MCLGDVRLMRFIANNQISITTTTAYTKVLDRNPQRVGLLLPNAATNTFWWFGQAQPLTTIGMISPSGGGVIPYFSYITHGPLLFEEVWVRQLTAGSTFFVIEQILAREQLAILQSIGLK